MENDRHGVNITVLIPMRDFAKLKILEVSTISWQYFGWSLVYLRHCEFLVFGEFFGSMGAICMKRCAMGLMSAIGPEMTSVG